MYAEKDVLKIITLSKMCLSDFRKICQEKKKKKSSVGNVQSKIRIETDSVSKFDQMIAFMLTFAVMGRLMFALDSHS